MDATIIAWIVTTIAAIITGWAAITAVTMMIAWAARAVMIVAVRIIRETMTAWAVAIAPVMADESMMTVI